MAQVLLKANVIVLETFSMSVEYVEAQVLLMECDCAGNVLDECGVCGGAAC